MTFNQFAGWVRTSLEISHEYAIDCVKDVPDERLAEQPAGVVNHAAWTLGHLVWGCHQDLVELGGVSDLPESWTTLFGTGSTPQAEREVYPDRETLVASLHGARAALVAALERAGPDGMERAVSVEMIRPYLPTVGHLVTQIVVAHTAYHVGQLSIWRRAMGFGGVGYPYL